jgi:hypothetical protein
MQHSFKTVPLSSDTLAPTFAKLLEVIPRNQFLISVGALAAFAVTSSALMNHCPFRRLFSHGNRKKSGGDKS